MNKNVKPVAPRALYQQKFTSARYNLLLVIGMTLINIVMLFLGGSSYFLFSATIPYSLSIDGAYYTGKLPEEFYTDMPADAQFFPDTIVDYPVQGQRFGRKKESICMDFFKNTVSIAS